MDAWIHRFIRRDRHLICVTSKPRQIEAAIQPNGGVFQATDFRFVFDRISPVFYSAYLRTDTWV